MSRAVLSLGSNLGDRYGHLRRGGGRTGRRGAGRVRGVRDAALGRPGPAGLPQRGRSLVADDVDARRLAGTGRHALERAAGRVRDPERRFGPRTLDVDVIAVWTDDGEPVISRRPGADPAAPAGPPAGVRAAARGWTSSRTPELPGHGLVTDLLRDERGRRPTCAGLRARPRPAVQPPDAAPNSSLASQR